MAQYRNAVMTSKGSELLLKAQAGNCRIKFTRMVSGDGTYSEDEKTLEALQARTELKSQKQSFAFEAIDVVGARSVKLTANITNHNESQTMTEGYYIQEIGLYAQEDGVEGTEVLYSISVADVADFLPPYNGLNPSVMQII